jgi:hypothetical protein
MGMGMRELLRHTNVRLTKAYLLLALPVTAGGVESDPCEIQREARPEHSPLPNRFL